METIIDAKVRRVSTDLKEPKDGSERCVTLVVLSAEDLSPDALRALAQFQRKTPIKITLWTAQSDLPLGDVAPEATDEPDPDDGEELVDTHAETP